MLHQLRQMAQHWKDVQLIVRGEREQWLGFQVDYAEPESVRSALDQAISQTSELLKEYLDHDVLAITSARRGQEDQARQNVPSRLVTGLMQD